jgi:kynurenine formamidase
MHVEFSTNDKRTLRADLSRPIDLSTPILAGDRCVNAFHISPPVFEPVKVGSFIGSVEQGGACNCENLHLNAHGNGTHTECVGHISQTRVSINRILTRFHFTAELVTIDPATMDNGDRVVLREQLEAIVQYRTQALLIRTLPNTAIKLHQHYSGSNPTYLHKDAAQWVREQGYEHLLIDQPSVDREEDGGALLAHHAFWNFPEEADGGQRTITELFYAPSAVADGLYLLNLQIAALETDASPSKPVLYPLM